MTRRAAVLGASLVLEHVPDLVRYGSKPTREPGRLADIRGALRSYEDALAYPPHQVFVGARRPEELYGLAALRRLAAGLTWLNVVGAVSEDPGYLGCKGLVGDVAIGFGDWSDHDAYVSGPPAMVRATVEALRAQGAPVERVQYDPLTGD